MTAEQIATLRAVVDGPMPEVFKPLFRQAIDEREALLLAAKYAVENEPDHRQQTRYAAALRGAIAKAEAP